MNLYLRFILILIKCYFAPRINTLDESRLPLRVLPLDCDINFHLTNARYLSFMDLGRTYMLGQTNLFSLITKRGWLPVVVACEMSFIHALKPWQKFHLVTRILTWDEKYFYIEQRFETRGKVCAVGILKGAFIARGHKVAMQKILRAAGLHNDPPPAPEFLIHWKNLTEAKKAKSAN